MADEQTVNFGPYRLDATNARLWQETQPLRLTPKAFQVLCYLAERPGQLVTKDELFQAVWADTVVSDATLTSAIQEIRKALADNAREPQYVETVPKRGFRFIGEVVRSQQSGVGTEEPSANGQEIDIVMPALRPSSGQAPAGIQGPQAQASGESAWMPAFAGMTQPSPAPQDHNLSLQPAQALDASTLSAQRSWSVQSLMVMGLVLLVSVILTVQYLSRPTLSTQSSVLVPEEAKPPSLPLPDKPSIIVLPFTNMSEDPTQEYFSDGITEELTSSLSRLPSLFVIARTSAFTYKGKAVKVQEVSKEMGVRYVLEGSIRRAGERVRVTTQLIDATTGGHVWSERYDRPLIDIFAVQDEITQKIVTTLQLQLTVGEQGLIARKTTNNLKAYDSYLRGLAYYYRTTKEDNLRARELFENAIALDPQYAEAYARLGFTYFIEWSWRWSQDSQTVEQGLAMGHRAVVLNDSLPMAHALLGVLYVQKKQYEQALAESERAIAFDPNNAESYARQAAVLNMMGRSGEALPAAEHAMRLNPRGNVTQLIALGATYFFIGRYPEAISTLTSLLARNPNHLEGYLFLSASYLGQWISQQEEDDQALSLALIAAQRILTFHEASPIGHRLVGYISLWQKQDEHALTELERAVTLDPEEAGGYAVLAEALGWMRKTEESLQTIEEALRRKPLVVDEHLADVGAAYLLVGKPAEAIAPLKQYLSRYPHILGAHMALASAYSQLGQIAEARAAAAEVMRINPQFSLEVHKQRVPLKDPVMLERHIAALRKAGLK